MLCNGFGPILQGFLLCSVFLGAFSNSCERERARVRESDRVLLLLGPTFLQAHAGLCCCCCSSVAAFKGFLASCDSASGGVFVGPSGFFSEFSASLSLLWLQGGVSARPTQAWGARPVQRRPPGHLKGGPLPKRFKKSLLPKALGPQGVGIPKRRLLIKPKGSQQAHRGVAQHSTLTGQGRGGVLLSVLPCVMIWATGCNCSGASGAQAGTARVTVADRDLPLGKSL